MKKINRHNYEEYFLLYVDNELNAQQRKEVEKFAAENQDISEELSMLKESKLPEDFSAYSFDKTSLFRQEGNTINISNYESFFLLHIDHELNNAEESELKIFIAAHPQLNEELHVLQQAVLPKEKIEFANKKVLYRKEKDTRVVPFGWMKLAVAAAFLGLMITAGFIFEQKNNIKTHPVALIKTQTFIKQKPIIAPSKNLVSKDSLSTVATSDSKSLNESKTKQPEIGLIHKNASAEVIKTKQDNVAVQQPAFQKNNGLNIVPARVITNDNKDSIVRLTAKNNPVIVDESDADELKKEQAIYAANTANRNANETSIQPAVYHQINTADDEDKSLYLGSIELNKDKVKNIFKKASRIFGSKAKNKEDGKDIKVADLDINTQNL